MVYNYTIPRAPIAAHYDSPGPSYGLPSLVGSVHHDPRSVHSRGSSYSFGVRHAQETDDCSPGPRYLVDPKMYRTGRDSTPHYSMLARRRDPIWAVTPGPAAYKPESYSKHRAKPTPPAFSFGSRPKRGGASDSPGPCAYNVSSPIGGKYQIGVKCSPSYSLAGRCHQGSFDEDLRKTPGPGAYHVTDIDRYKSAPPRYSLTSRHHMPGDDETQKPGPGAHSVEKVWAHKREPPKFSFGIRHSQYASTLLVDGGD